LFFNNTEDRKVTTELANIDVSGGTALARFRWKISFQSGNTPQAQDIMKQWELQSDNGNWKIVKEK
jgi:ketosteroid isomerase-like protein